MRNSINRVIKKPRYLMETEEEEESNHSTHSTRSHSPSTDEKSKGKNKRGYNPDIEDLGESEYLYGSDFELEDFSEDKEESEEEEDEEGRERGDDAEEGFMSEGEESVSSYSTTHSSTPHTPLSLHPPSRPPTPIPVWLQDRPYPPLDLPKSSDDLLLPKEVVLKAVGIYEVLRHFRTLVRLSPMRFEDFCAALVAEEQSALLAEVHMSLLKALIREEDSQQTHFGPLDQKDSINVILYFIDALTWPESLRLYLQSDLEFSQPLAILDTCNYPFTSLENRCVPT